ncbi:MAG: MinD/ParA family protein [Deltaproteobacteria bacterium]|nr:MinD/ParA family protein [Deltaproteobacteria bacterium]
MTTIISVASGKGGVGKSVVVTNLGLLLSRQGRRIVLADLDVGGADIHILFGEFNPTTTITDFIYKKVDSLEEVVHPLVFPGLSIIPGTGDTLATANMPFARKKRLINHLKRVDADVIIVDVGAGTGFHALDFFLMADRHLTVATPDPTSVLDLYRFVKLAAIRRVLSVFLSRGNVADTLAHRDFASVEEVLTAVGKTDEKNRAIAEGILEAFKPSLILNRVAPKGKVNTLQLKMTLKKYVGCDITTLGEIPDDEAVLRSVRAFLPVVDYAPESPAARGFAQVAAALIDTLEEESTPPTPEEPADQLPE